jgi:tryptophanyl-tRNA synthetase
MTIFSGIRPSGPLHIGNYLGAIKNWLSLQSDNDCFFCIVDLHAITTPFQPEQLKKDILDLAALYLSLGLDPDKSSLFIQSKVKEHAELCWLLGSVTPLGELSRMTQYKDKSKSLKASEINASLLYYPILMAADILLYQTEAVPVGEDQKQHVELARAIAQKFNNRFGETFKIPKALLLKEPARIKSLSSPDKKMSKTDDPRGAISFLDSPEEIRKNIMSAVTDSDSSIKYDPEKRKGLANLLVIYSNIENITISEAEKRFAGQGYREFKEGLAESVINFVSPIQKKYKEWINQPDQIKEILESGQQKAQQVASKNIFEIKKKMGLS